jgi:hypothetical protein
MELPSTLDHKSRSALLTLAGQSAKPGKIHFQRQETFMKFDQLESNIIQFNHCKS